MSLEVKFGRIVFPCLFKSIFKTIYGWACNGTFGEGIPVIYYSMLEEICFDFGVCSWFVEFMFVSSSRVVVLCEENIKIYFVYMMNNSVDLDHVSTFTPTM